VVQLEKAIAECGGVTWQIRWSHRSAVRWLGEEGGWWPALSVVAARFLALVCISVLR
jgi:hypothetical protein